MPSHLMSGKLAKTILLIAEADLRDLQAIERAIALRHKELVEDLMDYAAANPDLIPDLALEPAVANDTWSREYAHA